MGRQAGPFFPERIFDNLNKDFLSDFQGNRVFISSSSATFLLRRYLGLCLIILEDLINKLARPGKLFFDQRINSIRQIQEPIAPLADIYKSCIDRRENGLHFSLINIPQKRLITVNLNVEIIDPTILDDGNKPFLLLCLYKNFSRQNNTLNLSLPLIDRMTIDTPLALFFTG